jgi:hypothetical protein
MNTANSGFIGSTCAHCGRWVPANTQHFCGFSEPYQAQPQIPYNAFFPSNRDAEILQVLTEIRGLLTKLLAQQAEAANAELRKALTDIVNLPLGSHDSKKIAANALLANGEKQ